MTKQKIIYFSFLIIFPQILLAQKTDDPRVKKISKAYFQLQDDISAGKYYQNYFKINADTLKEHKGVGKFNQQYYTLDEKYVYELDDNAKPILRNIRVVSNLSVDENIVIEYQGDFMFDKKGKLMYHMQSQKYSEEQDFKRIQFFYENEQIIQVHIQVDIVEEEALTVGHKGRAEDVKTEAKEYWDKFYQKQVPDMEALMDF